MEDLRGLLRRAEALRVGRGRAVLATIVGVTGSSVRRPGARVLLEAGGRATGFLSAGCVERDLEERVEAVLGAGRPELVRYRPDELADPVLGLGLTCGGGMEVLLEPWPPPEPPDPLEAMAAVRRTRDAGGLATVVAPPELAGARAAVVGAGEVAVAAPPPLRWPLGEAAAAAREREGPARIALADGAAEVLAEPLLPPLRVLIQGTGPPALALARLAAAMGWEPVLLPVGAVPDPEAVPPGCGLSDPGSVVPDRWTVAVLLAHDTRAEVGLLRRLLPSPVRYLGVMGSRGRRRALRVALEDEGVEPGSDELARLHMPVGLDLGAETAEEIALAVAAEILAALRGRHGGRLRDREGPIHERGSR